MPTIFERYAQEVMSGKYPGIHPETSKNMPFPLAPGEAPIKREPDPEPVKIVVPKSEPRTMWWVVLAVVVAFVAGYFVGNYQSKEAIDTAIRERQAAAFEVLSSTKCVNIYPAPECPKPANKKRRNK